MHKKIILLILSLIFIISCSSPSNPDNGNEGNNGGSTVPPPTGPTEEELIKKYGIDIGQDNAAIIQQIGEKLQLYFEEYKDYRIIFIGNPRSYDESLSSLIIKAVSSFQGINEIDIDIKYINFKDGTISGDIFSGPTDDENIGFNFIFPENKIKTIGDNAFSFLYNLKEITIPASVTRIGLNAFNNCGNLIKLNLKNGLETIDNSAFLQVPFLSEVIIPDSVKTIGDSAFANDTIQKLQLSSSLEFIGMQAFINLEIEELIIPASVKTIGDQAFAYSFTTLKRVVYLGTTPNDITSTGTDVFKDCSMLTTLIVPNATNPNDEKWKTFLGGNFTIVKQN
ncbi:leucine-rich repeat domain-containing protein [Brachyspira pilosicoli]|uniref:leucine-rich repeat domain-containing protein n=1 Tax=Brachyspira pilosicoli TaxID=52584 RepID=UPI001C67CFD6|nr:leucine-rich repeat domain-containing protein [Brachyspira pilosicoli]MBW5382221.1 leucine-rich repeat domain-containing protein [Brachyspira pilosicoli]